MIAFEHLEIGKTYIVGLDLGDGYSEKSCVILDLNSQGLQYIELEGGKKNSSKNEYNFKRSKKIDMSKGKTIWRDHQGNEIPGQYVPAIAKKQDRLVKQKIKKALDMEAKLRKLKVEIFNDCDMLWHEMQEAENVRTGKKSYSISTFDKAGKIEIDQSERIEFDSKIEIAKAKINEFLETKENADTDLKTIAHHAFETTKGKLDVKNVLSLKTCNIKHPLWKRAMELIDESMARNNSKRYVRISHKDDNGEYQNIKLNISSV